ncbi:MAG: DNA internalization-related competence protein ComEC/Rec2 [Streptococcaceae bacterium]|nr:DNA internalization-related competence protein ComEC/Rec2 [Streptococcaceae bacterium]
MLPTLLIIGAFLTFTKFDEIKNMKTAPSQIARISPLIDTMEINGDLLSFRGRSDGRVYQAYYTLKSEKEQGYYKKLSTNVLLKIEAELEIPEGQRNFNGFDYKSYLKTQNIYQIVNIKQIKRIESRSNLDLRIVRRKAILWANEHFPAPMSSYMTGLLFGYLGKDFDQMSDVYGSLGIIHLFALSGMQVNFFIDHFRKILLRLGCRKDIVDKLQLPFSVFYAYLTGLSSSVLRSLLQKNISASGLDNFSLTFFSLPIIQPKFLLTAGGQLTIMYTFMLVMLSSHIGGLSGFKKILLESCLLSLAVLPLLILNFHVFQPLSIVLTFTFSVIFDVLMLPALVLIFMLSVLTSISLDLNFIFNYLETMIKFLDKVFHYPLVFGTPSLFVFLGLLFFIALFIDCRRKKVSLLFLFAVIVLFLIAKNPVAPTITMIDIGQGDSFLLRDSFNRRTILIDTGGKVSFMATVPWKKRVTDANAERTLIPYLQSVGVGSIDTLILTHTDEDHVGDLEALANKIKIKEILVDRGALTVPKMSKKLQSTNVPVKYAKVGQKLPIFDGHLQILTNGYTGDGGNNDSIATYGQFYGTRFLFTGDLEKEGEEALLRDYPNLKADVLKAGHHGSKTASTPAFVQAVQPKIALISAGVNNRYHHPHQENLETFEAYGVQVFRTDKQGAVKFSKVGKTWKIENVK